MSEYEQGQDEQQGEGLGPMGEPGALGPSGTPSEPGGLAERMRRRAQELADQHSEIFPVPGYASMLAVELRALSLESTGRIAQRHERVRDPATRTLYIAADIVLSATEGFFEVDREGERTSIEQTWMTLAVGVKDIDPSLSPRQGLIALLGGVHVAMLAREWDEWMGTEREESDEEMTRDFGMTR